MLRLAAAHAALHFAAVAATVRPAEAAPTLSALWTSGEMATTAAAMASAKPSAHGDIATSYSLAVLVYTRTRANSTTFVCWTSLDRWEGVRTLQVNALVAKVVAWLESLRREGSESRRAAVHEHFRRRLDLAWGLELGLQNEVLPPS
jgi:hypothetical protein